MSNLLITEAGLSALLWLRNRNSDGVFDRNQFSLLAERKRQSCGRRGRSWRRLAQLSFIMIVAVFG